MSREGGIAIEGLSFAYPALHGREPSFALRDITLAVPKGEIVVLSGQSGSGKSTLLQCINGLVPHTVRGTREGGISVAGLDPADVDPADMSATVGTVFQNPDHQLFSFTVEEEVAFGPEQAGWAAARIGKGIHEALETMHLLHLRHRPLDELSWGERQRVAIASVIVTRPDILLLDEPFSGIDGQTAKALIRTLQRLNREKGMTIVLSEHRLDAICPLLKRLILLRNGTVAYDGNPRRTAVRDSTPPDARTCAEWHRPISSAPYDGGAAVPSVSLRSVSYTYPGASVPALDRISLDLFPGEIAVIAGANGAGKSTLMQHLNGLLRPDAGAVHVRGHDIATATVAETARTVGLIGQHADYQLFCETIRDELAFGPRNCRVPEEAIRQRIADLARHLAFQHLPLTAPPLCLSTGEKQRVAIAGILTMGTEVVAFDEPTLGLDPAVKCGLADLFGMLRDQGKTIIIATHDRAFTHRCADREIVLDAGHLASDRRIRPVPPREQAAEHCP
ncbi:MAG: ABC transporter ATP-binding protein [Methanomicrobiales archaeon]|nr:ABC transporter ATP-binding protein [Methanomicrobiales archaeon]